MANINLDRGARKSGRHHIDKFVQKDLLGGRSFVLTGSINDAIAYTNSDSGDFPITQDALFNTYAICGVAICEDESKAGP